MTARLNDQMDFDRVIEVHADGRVTDAPAGIYAPEVSVELDADGSLVSLKPNDIMIDGGWSLLNGYSAQHGYRGPIMHSSEFIGGDMERHILSTPGIFVAVVVTGIRPDDHSNPGEDADDIGWAVAQRRD